MIKNWSAKEDEKCENVKGKRRYKKILVKRKKHSDFNKHDVEEMKGVYKSGQHTGQVCCTLYRY